MSKKKEIKYTLKPFDEEEDNMEVQIALDSDDTCQIMSIDAGGPVVKLYRPACSNEVCLKESLILAVAEYIKEQRKK